MVKAHKIKKNPLTGKYEKVALPSKEEGVVCENQALVPDRTGKFRCQR